MMNPPNLLSRPNDDMTFLIWTVADDMAKFENGHIWPLTCYAPFFAKPGFPGFHDKSFEEVRLGYYNAARNRTVERYKQILAQIMHKTNKRVRMLQNPTPEAVEIIQEIHNTNLSCNSTRNLNIPVFVPNCIWNTNNCITPNLPNSLVYPQILNQDQHKKQRSINSFPSFHCNMPPTLFNAMHQIPICKYPYEQNLPNNQMPKFPILQMESSYLNQPINNQIINNSVPESTRNYPPYHDESNSNAAPFVYRPLQLQQNRTPNVFVFGGAENSLELLPNVEGSSLEPSAPSNDNDNAQCAKENFGTCDPNIINAHISDRS